ncbi:hypothetical protein KIL84_003892 [Mauremys mutica]|uniref:Uncharacterized protein n=1 Tax=Mauremys mutica TaxID=74926 RepID=A0A9D3WUN3_9SAUR|nr:hypothetical protein KIL84_003892 [Mauremys mutica]
MIAEAGNPWGFRHEVAELLGKMYNAGVAKLTDPSRHIRQSSEVQEPGREALAGAQGFSSTPAEAPRPPPCWAEAPTPPPCCKAEVLSSAPLPSPQTLVGGEWGRGACVCVYELHFDCKELYSAHKSVWPSLV